jgi:hypothetical protein
LQQALKQTDKAGVTGIDIKRKYRLLKVCYAPVISAPILAFSFFLAVDINSANEAHKAGCMCR